jgi:hypothetical protein
MSIKQITLAIAVGVAVVVIGDLVTRAMREN